MNIILFGKCNKPICLQFSQPSCYISILALFVVFTSIIFAGGYWSAQSEQSASISPEIVQQWKKTIAGQQVALQETRQNAQAHLDALSQRLGQLQAHIYRMNALGRRLTKMAKLDKGEFNFDLTPAVGGPISGLELSSRKSPDIVAAMDELNLQLQDRGQQLSILESMLLHDDLQKKVLLSGRPIKKGWMSSFYGMRSDPFTGKRVMHEGVDYAGKMGSDILAVAAGVVIWSGDRYGYGNMVEIDHGNGYSTKYAHNSENTVELGDKITKGQVIAKMGSSGRSTGPHVHFEVIKNNRAVDPLKHVRAVR